MAAVRTGEREAGSGVRRAGSMSLKAAKWSMDIFWPGELVGWR